MKNIEKSLTEFMNGRKSKINYQELSFYIQKNCDGVVGILFKITNNQLDTMTGSDSIKRVSEVLGCIAFVINEADTVDRRIIARRLTKLDEKIDRIKYEKRRKLTNYKQTCKDLCLIQDEIDRLKNINSNRDSKSYDMIAFVLRISRDFTYLECIFAKMPSIVNAKDKEKKSLYENVLEKLIQSMLEGREDNVRYYDNLSILIMNQQSFSLSEYDKRSITQMIYHQINKMNCKKKLQKKNKRYIEMLEKKLIEIKEPKKIEQNISQIANKYNVHINFDSELLEKVKNIHINFDSELIEKAKLAKEEKKGEFSDRKVIEDYVITIDGPDAQEIDDALSCKKLDNGNYELGVHIASVLSYFDYDSDVIQEALERSQTIYLSKRIQIEEFPVNGLIPMFPYEFAAKKASLLPKEARFARSYIFEIDKNGHIVREEFFKSIVISNAKTTYRDIDKVIKYGSENKQLEGLVHNLQEVSLLLDKSYKGLDSYEQIKAGNSDLADLRVKREGAEKLVYQAMVLTGNRVATFFAENNYPCLYRVHDVKEDNLKKIQGMLDTLSSNYDKEQLQQIYNIMDGIYPRAWYASSGSHLGLGLEHYCHCTSGLRRGADIVNEHALEVCYDKTPTEAEIFALQQEIEIRAKEMNEKEETIDWFGKNVKKAYQKRR